MTDIENKIREAWNAQNPDDHSSPTEWTRFVMTGWGGYCERMEVVRSFRKGYLASHQEAAAQIAEKEVEIKILNREVKARGNEKNFIYSSLMRIIKARDESLTAIRQTEEKTISLLRDVFEIHGIN